MTLVSGKSRMDPLQKLESVHFRHAQIRNHHIDGKRFKNFERVLSTRRQRGCDSQLQFQNEF